MSVENLKSASVTNLDAVPIVPNTVGQGAPGELRAVGDYSTASAAASATSTYQLARIPSNAVVKQVFFESEAQTAGKFEVGLYYSTGKDGTVPSLAGGAIDSDFFASDVDAASAVAQLDVTNESGNYPLNKRNQPIWKASGLSADPGGFFDVVATVHTTAITTGTGKLGALVYYVG